MANSSYDVLVVGGGVIGWSAAWHLLSRQTSLRVAVVDPDSSRCTSLRGAGGSRAQFSTEANVALSMLSIEEFKRFKVDVGSDIGYQQNGYLLYTADADRASKMRATADHQRSLGVSIQELLVDELKRRVKPLNTTEI